jgi:hypothetical protein
VPHVAKLVSAMSTLLAALAPESEEVTIYGLAPVTDVAPTAWVLPRVEARVPAHWDLVWCEPTARAFNDRRYALALAQELGCALPRAATLTSLEAIDAHVGDGPWVLKAPWSSAGRHRVHGTGRLFGEHRVAAQRLLARTGALTYEPWCDRICDVGVCGVAGGEVTEPHEIVNGPRGNFLGIELRPEVLAVGEHDQLVMTAERVAQRLYDDGYRGPFGIDAFVHRVDGERVLHPLCEINARYTFGHVARALGERFGARRLEFGRHPPGGSRLLVHAEGIKAWVV